MELYRLKDSNRQRFLKTPKDLILNKCYRNILTSDAKLVYSLLLDRMELSRKNEWVNENNEIYLIFTKKNIATALGISPRTVYKAFNLIEDLNLIKQERQGLNRPNKIYIAKTNADIKGNCKICRSEPEECAGQELNKMQGNETDCSETYHNETDTPYIEPKKSSVAMSIFLQLYENMTGEKHKAVKEDIYYQVEELMNDISYQVEEHIIEQQLYKYFDEFNYSEGDYPTLYYFDKVAGRYFFEYCREVFHDRAFN